MERHERCKSRQGQKNIKQQRDNPAQDRNCSKSLIEDIGQGDEDERRTAIGRDTHRESRREDHQSGKDSHHEVDDRYLQGCLEQIGLSAEVGSIGTDTTHTDAERIERLPQSTEKHTVVHLGEIGFQQELHALSCIRQQAGSHHDDKQEDEQDGHHNL